MDLDVLRCLSVSDLELVLTNPFLKLEFQDQLYDAIVSLAGESGSDVLVLLRHVEFAFLSEYKLGEFLDRILNNTIWNGNILRLAECPSTDTLKL